MSQQGYLVRVPPDEWSLNHTPGAAAQATISRAANATLRHYCRSISWTLACGATAQAVAAIVALRDGATGAGTILWSKQVILPANGVWSESIDNLNIPGTSGNAMTLEFTAAGAAGTFESVAITGYDEP
jgi:hypothetical protein